MTPQQPVAGFGQWEEPVGSWRNPPPPHPRKSSATPPWLQLPLGGPLFLSPASGLQDHRLLPLFLLARGGGSFLRVLTSGSAPCPLFGFSALSSPCTHFSVLSSLSPNTLGAFASGRTPHCSSGWRACVLASEQVAVCMPECPASGLSRELPFPSQLPVRGGSPHASACWQLPEAWLSLLGPLGTC